MTSGRRSRHQEDSFWQTLIRKEHQSWWRKGSLTTQVNCSLLSHLSLTDSFSDSLVIPVDSSLRSRRLNLGVREWREEGSSFHFSFCWVIYFTVHSLRALSPFLYEKVHLKFHLSSSLRFCTSSCINLCSLPATSLPGRGSVRRNPFDVLCCQTWNSHSSQLKTREKCSIMLSTLFFPRIFSFPQRKMSRLQQRVHEPTLAVTPTTLLNTQ